VGMGLIVLDRHLWVPLCSTSGNCPCCSALAPVFTVCDTGMVQG